MLLVFNSFTDAVFNVCTVENPYIEFILSQGQTLICVYLIDIINTNKNHT